MIDAWLVVREEKHIDDRHWVCLDKEDALIIAGDVTDYWIDQYKDSNGEVDDVPCEGQIFRHDQEDSFYVYVIPTTIRGKGENQELNKENS